MRTEFWSIASVCTCHGSLWCFHRLQRSYGPAHSPNQCVVSLFAPSRGLTPAPSVCLHPCPLHSPLFPTHKHTRVTAWLSATWRNWHQGLCGRGALGTFILFSLPLCFQTNSTSVNKHRPGTLSRLLLSAPYGLQTWRTFISTSCTAGLKKPLQQAESSLQVTPCTVSCFQSF